MNSSNRAETIFYHSFERSGAERQAYLDKECGDDAQLRAQVDALLGADAQSDSFLQSPLEKEYGRRSGETSQDPLVGQRVGPFHVQRRIAAGGMGVVYVAIQTKPQRKVALKVMHAGAFSTSALRRFEQEEEVLARLRHANIAQIYDAGTHNTAVGPVPYFAMEYLEGAKSITAYSDDNDLSHRQKLRLFLLICDAVQHGHQRGIIHRDLKPANILVVDPGVPKVIDFGVARLVDSDKSAATMHSKSGQLIGTLRYMSPEQSLGDATEIDTRSDVYALGVVLYELLTGQLPYDMTTLSPFDIPRIIREVQAGRMVTIDPSLKGDLEVITLKALEKDRDRRYQSVSDFARDLQHFLKNEAIEAKRDRPWYVLRKAISRHKSAVLVACFIVLLVTGSTIALAILYRDANAQRQHAQASLQRSMAAETRAEEDAATANQAVSFLVSLFKVTNPYSLPELSTRVGGDVTAREILDRGVERIRTDLSDQPNIRGTLLTALGNVYGDLALYDKAESLLRDALEVRKKSLGPQHATTAKSLKNLGNLLVLRGHNEEARTLIQEALDVQRRVLEKDDLEIADTLRTLGFLLYTEKAFEAAEQSHREALAITRKRLDENHPDVAQSLNDIALALYALEKYEQAQPLYDESLRIKKLVYGPNHMEVALTLNNIAALLRSKGQIDAAQAKYRESLKIKRSILGNEHPSVATTLNNLAALLHDKHEYQETEKLYREALAIRRTFLGEQHPSTAQVINNLGELMMDSNRVDQAEPFFRKALAIRKATLGNDDPETLRSLVDVGWYHRQKGDFDRAEPYYVATLEARTRTLGANHRHTVLVRRQLAALRKERAQKADPK